MKVSKTQRGFTVIEFEDRYGVSCSLQKSSLATTDAIWLGCDSANPRTMVRGKGWTPIDMPDGVLCNTRMHLTQDQVRDLLPFLQHFVDTGELPDGHS